MVLGESISLLKERLVKVRHLWRRRQIVEGNPAALGIFELLKDKHGVSKAQSLLGLSV